MDRSGKFLDTQQAFRLGRDVNKHFASTVTTGVPGEVDTGRDAASPNSDGISVILTVLNEGEGMAALLEALLDQSRAPEEVVIVDGGSRDGTIAVLEMYATRDARIRFCIEPGVNIAQGRNSAIRKASHRVIAVTDGGCRPERDWLKELVGPLLHNEDIGAVAGRFTIDWKTNFEFFSGLLCMPGDFDNEETCLFYGRSSAFLKAAWEKAGGYPEWLYTAEDTLFALRVRQLGYRVAYAPGSVVSWRPRPTFRKLAKMFFLYGRGNGRIERGSLEGSLYWLRNHALWVGSLLAGFVFPWLWLFTIFVLCWLYATMALPVLREVRKTTANPWREWYVPLIVMTRNIATNLGYILGMWEFHHKLSFQDKLRKYLAGSP
jgi:succinoglycan biosynthesis protein ExoA